MKNDRTNRSSTFYREHLHTDRELRGGSMVHSKISAEIKVSFVAVLRAGVPLADFFSGADSFDLSDIAMACFFRIR